MTASLMTADPELMLGGLIKWISSLFDSGKSVEELASRIGVNADQLRSIDRSYREFSIAKKSGKRRLLAAPNDELKSLQRKILRRLLAKLKTHPLATGFQPNLSFVDNARCHQSQAVVIRIDLVDFFPSIKSSVVQHYFRKIGWNDQAATLLTDLTTHQGCLPQGAPTSPKLSNLVNYFLDLRLSELSKRFGAVYTRYADDITFSSSDPDLNVHDLLRLATRIIRESGYRPHLGKKFDVRRPHQRQIVTGLVVNQRANLSREKRRWLRAVEHRTKLAKTGGYLGPRPTLTKEQLAGWHALQNMISPDQK